VGESLFDNTKPKPVAARKKPPVWVVDELVKTHGLFIGAVRKMHAAQAFAVLYGCRERKANGGRIAERKRDLATRLTTAVASDDSTPHDLVDLVCECVSLLDAPAKIELCRVAANLLVPPRST
jgi:hypothetical protein